MRVIDWTTTIAGPLATRLLADLGCEVIKLEQVAAPGDYPRGVRSSAVSTSAAHIQERLERGETPWNQEPSFNTLHRAKKSLALNLADARGRDVMLRLVEHSDGLITNFSARVMPNLGLDFETLLEHNPAFVGVAITGYGRTGSRANAVAFGPIIEAESGLSYLGSYPDYPVVSKNVYPDGATAAHAFAFFLAGLERARSSGEGSFIDLSMLEVAASLLSEEYAEGWRDPQVGDRPLVVPNQHRHFLPNGCFETADGRWLALTVRSDDEWRRLCAALQMGDSLAGLDHDGRLASMDAVYGAVEAGVRKCPAAALAADLERAGIPAELVAHADDLVEGRSRAVDPDFYVSVGQAGEPPRVYPGSPFAQDGERLGERTAPPPPYGAHTLDVLSEVCQFTQEEIAALLEARVVATATNAYVSSAGSSEVE